MQSKRLVCLTVVLLLATVTAALPADIQRRFSVSAQSEISVAPDEARLLITVSSNDRELSRVKTLNNELTRTVLPLAKKHTLRPQDLKVADFDLSPQYDQIGVLNGYQLKRKLDARIHDFQKIEPFLAAIIEAGIDEIDSVKFQIWDQRKHQTEARRLAFQYAKEEAKHLADLSEVKLGPVVSVHESIQYNEDARLRESSYLFDRLLGQAPSADSNQRIWACHS